MTPGEIITAIVGGIVAVINAVAAAWILIMLHRNRLASDKRAQTVVNEVKKVERAAVEAVNVAVQESVRAIKKEA